MLFALIAPRCPPCGRTWWNESEPTKSHAHVSTLRAPQDRWKRWLTGTPGANRKLAHASWRGRHEVGLGVASDEVRGTPAMVPRLFKWGSVLEPRFRDDVLAQVLDQVGRETMKRTLGSSRFPACHLCETVTACSGRCCPNRSKLPSCGALPILAESFVSSC